jgi:hypothetical protein
MFYTSTCGFYLWYLIYVLYEQIMGSFSLLVCFRFLYQLIFSRSVDIQFQWNSKSSCAWAQLHLSP